MAQAMEELAAQAPPSARELGRALYAAMAQRGGSAELVQRLLLGGVRGLTVRYRYDMDNMDIDTDTDTDIDVDVDMHIDRLYVF